MLVTFRGLAPARAVREPLDSNKFKIFLKIFKGVGREALAGAKALLWIAGHRRRCREEIVEAFVKNAESFAPKLATQKPRRCERRK